MVNKVGEKFKMEYRVIRTDDELYHYGVKGMKWGKRKAQQKEEYGLSKREVKKKVKEAKKNYRRKEDPHHSFSGITGKNWEKVKQANKNEVENDSEINKLKAKRDKAYKAAEASRRASEISDSFQDFKSKRNSTDGQDSSNNISDNTKRKSAASTAFDLTSDILQAQGDQYATEVNVRVKMIGEKYTKKYQDALLKDIGYKRDLDLGRKMLNEYNIQNNWGKYS